MKETNSVGRTSAIAPVLLLMLNAASGAQNAPALDNQEAGLRTSLAQTAAVIVRSGDAIEVDYPLRLAFVADGTELLPAAKEMLGILAASLRAHEHTQVVVAVYTDAIGSSDFNQQQSLARATVVVDWLRGDRVAAARLIARGVGEAEPLSAENTAEGRDLNRRLRLTVTPLSS